MVTCSAPWRSPASRLKLPGLACPPGPWWPLASRGSGRGPDSATAAARQCTAALCSGCLQSCFGLQRALALPCTFGSRAWFPTFSACLLSAATAGFAWLFLQLMAPGSAWDSRWLDLVKVHQPVGNKAGAHRQAQGLPPAAKLASERFLVRPVLKLISCDFHCTTARAHTF